MYFYSSHCFFFSLDFFLGIEPIVWKQAKLDNPDPEKLIPVPLIGFQELSRRMKCQEYETKQHQKRLDVIITFILFLSLYLNKFICFQLILLLKDQTGISLVVGSQQ